MRRRAWATGAGGALSRGLCIALALAGPAAAAGPDDRPECVVPAKAGGGFDLTCQLVQAMLQSTSRPAGAPPMRLSYLPGGIGAVAFEAAVNRRPADGNAVVAFSAGSLLNLAQGKFGAHSERDVRWLAAVATDYGVIAVARDSPYRNLGELVAALKARPSGVVIGAGGTIGSQDWVKAAMLARAAGVSHRIIRFVAFEGGGDALSALEGGHVQVFTGDAAEVAQHLKRSAGVRVLAVLAPQRLPGPLARVPTALEQGFDLQWATARGLYMGRDVPPEAFRQWQQLLERAQRSPEHARQLQAVGLYPFWRSGPELDEFIAQSMARYRGLAAEFELRIR
ncbi:MAG: tripartite tricarboxylate transporter substrate binding protein [Aquincola tertiaricarbonis]